MATIHRIEAASTRRKTDQGAHQTAGGPGAEIILFPGVRYERWSETHGAAQQPKRRRKQRDRLDIME
jgi:hypothetical protein